MSLIKRLSRLTTTKYFLLVLGIALLTHFPIISDALAATYYVNATNGNDGNTGLSEATPWKTIAKVNVSTFNPGDQILSIRREMLRENVNPFPISTHVLHERPL